MPNNYTHAEKQQALDEAHEVMKTDAEKLADIRRYVEEKAAMNINPVLRTDGLLWVIEHATYSNKISEMWEETARNLFGENLRLCENDKEKTEVLYRSYDEITRLREAFEEIDKELKRVYDSIEFSKSITIESLLEDIASIGGQTRQALEPPK